MQTERGQRPPHGLVEQLVTKEQKVTFLKAGDTVTIADREHPIGRVSLAKELGEKYDLSIPDRVPIYWLTNSGGSSKGAYVPNENVILFFENTDEETQLHELTHAVEYHQESSPGLLALYDRVKTAITEDSFEGDLVSFNFMKNIHEFIADGRTKPAFIQALKKEGLYDEFVRETAYLFDPSQTAATSNA